MKNLSFSKMLSRVLFQIHTPSKFQNTGSPCSTFVFGLKNPYCFMIRGPGILFQHSDFDLVFYLSTQILFVWKKSFKGMINANFFHTTYVQLFSIDQKQHTNRTMINLNDPHCALLSKGICHFESYEMSENFWLHTYFSIL